VLAPDAIVPEFNRSERLTHGPRFCWVPEFSCVEAVECCDRLRSFSFFVCSETGVPTGFWTFRTTGVSAGFWTYRACWAEAGRVEDTRGGSASKSERSHGEHLGATSVSLRFPFFFVWWSLFVNPKSFWFARGEHCVFGHGVVKV
jgi:hypothetical protein